MRKLDCFMFLALCGKHAVFGVRAAFDRVVAVKFCQEHTGNTADNGSLRIAYDAFLADAKRKGIDLNAKQDGFTPMQQFFLSFGEN